MISKSQVKYIQSLGQKKHRDELGLFIAEGPKLVNELLTSNATVTELYCLEEWKMQNGKWLKGIQPTIVSPNELERLSQLTTPNQVVAVVKKFPVEEPVIKGKISLVLDTMQDPGNLGTIIRTADWFGVQQIICSEDCVDVYNPKVVQATMGSIARAKIFYTNLSQYLKKENEIRIYATMLEGKDVSKMNSLTEGLILIGNESRGISDELIALANERITIARKGKTESLNAAVATGIVLSHLLKNGE